MSYNLNDPNQQWQPQLPIDSNNQQLQPTSPPRNPNGGNYQQQQTYTWTDGNTQGTHHQSQQSWFCQSQAVAPTTIQSPPVLSPPPMFNQGISLHQLMHQNAMNHSQQALAHHQSVMNSVHQNTASLMSNMALPIVQQTPLQSKITYQSVSSPPPMISWQQSVVQSPLQQPQIAYQPVQSVVSPPGIGHQQYSHQDTAVAAPSMGGQPQLHYTQNIYQQIQPHQSPALQHPGPQSSLPRGPQQQQHPIVQQRVQTPYHERPPSLQQKIKQTAPEVRFQDLEKFETLAQTASEAKEAEVRRLQAQLAAVERQRRQDAERNSRQLANLVRSQVTSLPAPTPAAFDMNALQKVIHETQARQLSAEDIERVIEDQVSKRLAGMATKADIQAAGAQMQNALSRVPARLNEDQVQQAVTRELNSVMQDVAKRVNQQRRIAAQRQQEPLPGQGSQARVQTDFVAENLPYEPSVAQPRNAGSGSRSQGTLPPAGHQGMASPAAPTAVPHKQSALASRTIEARPTPTQRSAALVEPPSRPLKAAIEGVLPQAVSSKTLVAYNRPAPATQAPESGTRRSAAPAHATPVRHQQLALEQLSTHVNIPGNALASVDRTMPASTAAPGNAPLPPAGNSQQRTGYVQPHATTALPAPAHDQNVQRACPASRSVQPTTAHRQLEAAPSQNQALAVTRPQSANLPNPNAPPQMVTQPRQIEGVSSQRQLESSPSSSAGYPTTGQELVHQIRDVAR
jgi:hypothetical protein